MNKVLEYFKGDELAASVWLNKYALKDEKGNIIEKTPDDMHKRMAKEFAIIESKYINKAKKVNKANMSNYGRSRSDLTENSIYNLFKNFKYIIPGGSVMSGLGAKGFTSLSNCFVIGSPKDDYASIMDTRKEQVQLEKRRGGVGLDLSKLRPRGAKVNNSAEVSTGAPSFMEGFSHTNNEVAQGGRRGALMLTMSINHPDIEEFITNKQDPTKITGANISVKVTNDFMNAVVEDKDFFLRFPIDTKLNIINSNDLYTYNKLYNISKENESPVYIKRIKAKELWYLIITSAHKRAEPGIIFEDTMIDYSPDGIYDHFKMVSTNPCGEIGMGAYDSCRLLHQVLPSYILNSFTNKAEIDQELLYKNSYEAMRLADDLVDLEIKAIDRILNKIDCDYGEFYSSEEDIEGYSEYFNKFIDNSTDEFKLWWNIRVNTLIGRRCGLGFTGLADAIAKLGFKYGSTESINAITIIMNTIFKAQLDCQIDMAIERGTFPSYDKELELKYIKSEEFNWYSFNNKLWYFYSMEKYGRRNISWSTVAPTGSVSILAQCSSGIEPIFMPYYQRKKKCTNSKDKVDFVDKVGEKYTLYNVIHPGLLEYIKVSFPFLTEKELEERFKDINYIEEIFSKTPYYNSTAFDVNWKQRVLMQASIQTNITHSISSTVNLHKDTSIEEVANIYMSAWENKLKGITIYIDGSRDSILSTSKSSSVINNTFIRRPKSLEAEYYQVKIKGTLFIVLVGLLNNKPYEIFTFKPLNPVHIDQHKGKITKVSSNHYKFNSDFINISSLSETNNKEENMTTFYISMLLRHNVDIKYIIKTAKKVDNVIASFTSAICRILSMYVEKEVLKGEVCPECNEVLIREGGCTHCSKCSYSKCG